MTVPRTFHQVSGGSFFRKWKEWKVGDFLIGKYLGTHVDQYGKTNYDVLLEEVSLSGQHNIVAGKSIALNYCASIERGMEKVREGDTVKIEYAGTVKLEEGPYKGKDSHRVNVYRAVPESQAASKDDVL